MVTAERARELLSIHGVIRPQPPDDWTGMLPLPAPVERFFQEIGPVDITIESYGNAFIALVDRSAQELLEHFEINLAFHKSFGEQRLELVDDRCDQVGALRLRIVRSNLFMG
jgi:hypothetical protein